MHCVILDDYQGVSLELGLWEQLPEIAVDVQRDHIATQEDLIRVLTDAEIIVAMRERTPFPRELIEQLPSLQLLITTGMRNAAIDMAAAREHGITVCGTASSSVPPTEHTWALILGLARNLHREMLTLHSRTAWQSTVGTDLAGAKLGILGLGNIGQAVALIARAFGMEVLAWSPHLTEQKAQAVGAKFCQSMDELLREADFVTLHMKLGDTNRKMISARELGLMKKTALLINTSRSGLIDMDALYETLSDNRIAGAGLDVFDEEPLPVNDRFRSLDNVLLTPHLGYVTTRNYTTYFQEAVENIRAYLDGAPIRVLNDPAESTD